MHVIYFYIIIIFYNYLLAHAVVVRIIGTLGNYDQRRLWKLICIVNPFDLLLRNKCFSLIHIGHN